MFDTAGFEGVPYSFVCDGVERLHGQSFCTSQDDLLFGNSF